MRLFTFCLSFLFAAAVFAGTVRLANDTSYKLRATVRGADGTYLGEMVVNPHTTLEWVDYWGGVGNYNSSRTPYIVTWFCMDGGSYSVCDNVATGATVTANSCGGLRYCKPPKKQSEKPSPKGPPTEEYLQQQEEEDAGPPQGYMQ